MLKGIMYHIHKVKSNSISYRKLIDYLKYYDILYVCLQVTLNVAAANRPTTITQMFECVAGTSRGNQEP
jgi:hypothetical protein